MKPYSIDLRQKIIQAHLEDNLSQRQLAKQFHVALSFIQKLLKQRRELGTIAPKIRTQQTPPKLNSEQLEILRQLVEARNDATLEELRQELHQKTNVLIARTTVDRMLRKLGYTVKKKPVPQRKVNGPSSARANRLLG